MEYADRFALFFLNFRGLVVYSGSRLDVYGQSVGPLSWLGLPRRGTEPVLVGDRNVLPRRNLLHWILLVQDSRIVKLSPCRSLKLKMVEESLLAATANARMVKKLERVE